MGTNPTKAADNIYCRCRKDAAKFNDKLNSREGAAELLNCSPSTIADYELGLTKNIPVEAVVRMADLYNAPQLKNYYCSNECPIGKYSVVQLEIEDLDRLTVKILASMQKLDSIKGALLNITADGVITDEEKPEFDNIIKALDNMSITVQELKLWAEKTMKGD